MTRAAKLLLDEMLNRAIAEQLRGRGHDVIAVIDDPDLIGAPDEQLLGYATTNDRCLVTANVQDFTAINASWLSRGHSHAGLIYLVNRSFPGDGSLIGAIVTALERMLSTGQVPSAGAESYLRR